LKIHGKKYITQNKRATKDRIIYNAIKYNKIRKRSGKEREKRYVCSLDFNVDSVVDDVTSGGREFHVHDAAAGKARSPIVRRRVEGTATTNDDAE